MRVSGSGGAVLIPPSSAITRELNRMLEELLELIEYFESEGFQELALAATLVLEELLVDQARSEETGDHAHN